MKDVTIYPARLAGEVAIPASKSMSHRAVICAGLSEGISNINNIGESIDIEATCEAMKSLGIRLQKTGSSLCIQGNKDLELKNPEIKCRESGSTLRFMIPVAALTGKPVTFHGEGRLGERSLEPYYRIFEKQGIKYQTENGRLPLRIEGSLSSGEFQLEGNISSQFISGLMFALPLLEGDSCIKVIGELESRPYIDMTMSMLQRFSIQVENHGYRQFHIRGNQRYKPADYTAEGDFSQAAFWLAAGALGSEITCRGLEPDSLQGDKVIIDIIERMGGRVEAVGNKLCSRPSGSTGITIDVSQCPDLVPILAVMGALSEGRTEIKNAARLRLKESDRLKAISGELGKLGALIEEREDGLVIEGIKALKGGSVESWNDHRIAMALAIAATRCLDPVTIRNADCVNKSYPGFWEHYKGLGGRTDERNMG